MQWFDAHNHLQDPRLGNRAERTVQEQRDAGVTGCVVNATCEDDWTKVSKLADDFPDFVRPAFGIHPWKAHTAKPGWQNRLEALLATNPNAGIGECGIDSWVDTPDIETQIPVFLDHLKMAGAMDRPLTIHCLKAWGHLFDCLEKQPPPKRFLMHSFAGSIEVARQVAGSGAYFSLSGYALHPRKSKLLKTFREIPSDRILLETDAPDMTPPSAAIIHPLTGGHNHPGNLPRIATRISDRMGLSPQEMSALTIGNTARWLGDQAPPLQTTVPSGSST